LPGYKTCSGETVRNAVGDRLQRPYYLSRFDHDWKIRNSRQRTDIGNYSFVNRTIRLYNKLPKNAFPSRLGTFRKRVKKVMSEVKLSEVKRRELEARKKTSISKQRGLKIDK